MKNKRKSAVSEQQKTNKLLNQKQQNAGTVLKIRFIGAKSEGNFYFGLSRK